MKGRWLTRLGGGDDSGFTLVETIVALIVATIVFTGLAYVAVGALKASMLSRTNQQATDLAGQRLEQVRDLPYAGVAMLATDLAGDPNITSCGATKCVSLPDGTSEPVYAATAGISPHVVTSTDTTTNQVTFTTRTYVTTPTDSAGAAYRRVSVEVEWKQGATTLTRWVSSIVSYTQRGLPLPVFKLNPVGSSTATVTANGSTAYYGFTLNNQGARDGWNLTMSGSRTWTWYLDDGDGVFEPLQDAVMTDAIGDGGIDTGFLSPTQTVQFWVASDVPLGSTAGTTNYTLSAVSALQPAATSGTSSAPISLQILAPGATTTPTPPVSPGPTGTAAPVTCPASSVPTASAAAGYTPVQYTLHNRSAANAAWPPAPYPATDPIASTSTVTQGIPLVAGTDSFTVPTGRAMPVYSSDLSTAGGRVLATGGSMTSSDTTKVVDWRVNVDKKQYSGTAVMTFWVGAVPTDTLTSVTLQTQLYKWVKSGSVYTQTNLGTPVTLTIPAFGCAGLQQVAASFSGLASGKLGVNEYLGVRVWNTGGMRVLLGYDVTGTYPATMTLPEK